MPLVRESLPIQFKKSPTLLFDIIHHIKEAGTDPGFSMGLEGGGGGSCQTYFISLSHAGSRTGPFCPPHNLADLPTPMTLPLQSSSNSSMIL